jgi:glutathione S-transferase
MKLELITFKFCPFGQRCLIALHEKAVEFETTFVDLSKPPPWFDAVSPLGKVPVLRADERTVFDSTVINELIDDEFPPRLRPADAIDRAWQGSWTAFAGELLQAQLAAYTADSAPAHRDKLEQMKHLVALLADAVEPAPFFGGEHFALVDAAYAPFFLRVRLMHDAFPSLGGLPAGLKVWADALLDRKSVLQSTPDRFDEGYMRFIRTKGSWLLRRE